MLLCYTDIKSRENDLDCIVAHYSLQIYAINYEERGK